MGKRFFSMNMSTNEKDKTSVPLDQIKDSIALNHDDDNRKTHSEKIKLEKPVQEAKQEQTSSTNTYTKKGYDGRIKFNEADMQKQNRPEKAVRMVEDADQLFGKKKEKVTEQDVKTVVVPTIALLIFSIINEIILVPLVIKYTVKYVLHGELTLKASLELSNSQMISYAGLILIHAYVLFSVALIGFTIFNLVKKAYAQKDLGGVAAKIMLYTFLIGFIIVVLDCAIPYNVSELVIKISTFGMHSIVKFLK